MRTSLCLLASLWIAGCAVVRFDVPGASDEAAYVAEHPYYAEFCALSQIKKKQGFGADIRGEIGGHSVFYLNGACRVPDTSYPVLQVCSPQEGVGLSENEHFRNAKWVATPGRDFFFRGGLVPGQPVTRDSYAAVKREAERLRIYDGITFNDFVFDAKPPDWDREDWRYEMSVATDFAVGLGRGRYCARVPVTKVQMGRMVDFLNGENAPYRAGQRVFRWSVFNDNCIHLAHNALAEAGIWRVWPIERFLPIAVFDFPVPRNEFVNLMRRTNDDWLGDPGAAYRDVAARNELLRDDRMPSYPGALAEAEGPLLPNEVYDTELKMIFYDEPTIGRYQRRFDGIYSEPRYLDRAANRDAFSVLARAAEASRRPLEWWLEQTPYRDDPLGFSLVYSAYYRVVSELARR